MNIHVPATIAPVKATGTMAKVGLSIQQRCLFGNVPVTSGVVHPFKEGGRSDRQFHLKACLYPQRLPKPLQTAPHALPLYGYTGGGQGQHQFQPVPRKGCAFQQAPCPAGQ